MAKFHAFHKPSINKTYLSEALFGTVFANRRFKLRKKLKQIKYIRNW